MLVVKRVAAPLAGVRIDLVAVATEVVDPLLALHRVEPAAREDRPCRIDSVGDAHLGRDPYRKAGILDLLLDRPLRGEQLALGIVRQPDIAMEIRLLAQRLCVKW